MDGPLAGSVTDTELHFDSDASKVAEVEVWYWYVTLITEMDSK